MAKKKPFKTKVNTAPKKPKKTPRPAFLATARDASKQAREAFDFDLTRRLNAENILNADELSGLYDLQRQLFTTAGGALRPITATDLRDFRAAVDNLKKRHGTKAFLGGIKPKQVIDLSWSADRIRANKEITMAAPVRHKDGIVQFQTNSGPKSNVVRHHVVVQFLNWHSVASSPAEPQKIVGELLKGNVKFDCSCERHTFWFRYIASIGGYAYGRSETGFPKIRNPNLGGIACKHVLRVMTVISQSPNFKEYMTRLIRQQRELLVAKDQIVKIKEMEELAKAIKKESYRQRTIKTTEEKRAQRAAQPAAKRREQNLKNKAQARAEERARQKAAKNAEKAYKEAKAQADNLLSKGFIDQTVYEQILAKAKQGV